MFKNRLVMFTVAFLPLILTALPLGILYASRSAGEANLTADMPSQFTELCPPDIGGG